MYRKSALDKLSTPEQLDRLITITTPRGWVALVTLCAVILLILVWAFFGRIPVTISGEGILINSGGVFEVASLGSGVIGKLHVREGDNLEPGTLIAEVNQPALVAQWENTAARLEELRGQSERTSRLETTRINLGLASLDQKQTELSRSIEVATERLKWLEGRAAAQKEAHTMGLITRSDLQETLQKIDAEKAGMANAKTQLKALESEKHALYAQREKDMLQIGKEISDAERVLAFQKLEIEEQSRIASPYRGTVTEIKKEEGSIVQKNDAVAALEAFDGELHAVVFVSAQAKRIRPGMAAQISPSTVKKENFGYMTGKVTSISALPATEEGMRRTLKNSLLVKQLSEKGAPFMLTLSLTVDTGNFSGFRWTSTEGPPAKIESGTTCFARVVVEYRKPIDMLLPALKSYLGIS